LTAASKEPASKSVDADDLRATRRDDFVAATLACLAEHGHQGTTVRRIARKAGVTPGLLTHYFAGKDALIAEAYRALATRIAAHFDEAIAAAGADPAARLSAFVCASFQPPNVDPALLRVWFNFWSLVVNDPAIRDIHTETYGDYRRRVETLVKDATAATGQDFSRPGLQSLAIGISALLDGLWLELCLDTSAFDVAEGERIARDMISARIGVDI
jgi:TetR/AcrR family transcriptional regulator, transcriptional repressor of bet genes